MTQAAENPRSTFTMGLNANYQIAALSQWVDDGQPRKTRKSEQLMAHIRIDKIVEEVGEVVEALIGAYGENPRKGYYSDLGKVQKELLDVATAALGAVEHLTSNQGQSFALLRTHVSDVYDRAFSTKAAA